MASLRRWCLRWDVQYVQGLLVREAGWGWRTGLGKKSMPGTLSHDAVFLTASRLFVAWMKEYRDWDKLAFWLQKTRLKRDLVPRSHSRPSKALGSSPGSSSQSLVSFICLPAAPYPSSGKFLHSQWRAFQPLSSCLLLTTPTPPATVWLSLGAEGGVFRF